MTAETGGRGHRGAARRGLRAAFWLTWALFGLSMSMFLASITLYVSALPVLPPSSWGTGGLSALLYAYSPFLAFPVVGALISSRRPANPIGWISLAVGFVWILGITSGSYAVYGLRMASAGSVPYPAAVGSLGEWLGPTAVLLFGTYLILLFPDGRLPSRRWRPIAWLSGAVIVLNIVVTTLTPGQLSDLPDVSNPFGLERYPWMAGASVAFGLLLPLCMLASALSLILRYRRSGGEERQQIKWLAFAASVVAFAVSTAVVSGTFLLPESPGGADPLLLNLLEDAITMSFAGVPVAIGFAVLKYRLYDIDVVINRALVYGSLTATLAAVYFGGVVLLQRLFIILTGERSTLAVVVSTLLIAALFDPLRRRIQSFIDRRFYRRKYDARKTLEAFSEKLRRETDLEALTGEVVGVVNETLQPAQVSVWLCHDTTSSDKEVG
jgi:hypothetical protein